MAMNFHYRTHVRDNGTSAVSPMLPVVLKGPQNSFETSALLDSGADVSTIPKAVADILGLDISEAVEKSFGIGGEVRTIKSEAELTVSKGHEMYRMRLPVLVVVDPCDFGVLIGRRVFFDKFKITFDQKNLKFSLKKNT